MTSGYTTINILYFRYNLHLWTWRRVGGQCFSNPAAKRKRSRPIRKANTVGRTNELVMGVRPRKKCLPIRKRFKHINYPPPPRCNILFVNRPTRFARTRASICIINWCVCARTRVSHWPPPLTTAVAHRCYCTQFIFSISKVYYLPTFVTTLSTTGNVCKRSRISMVIEHFKEFSCRAQSISTETKLIIDVFWTEKWSEFLWSPNAAAVVVLTGGSIIKPKRFRRPKNGGGSGKK